MNIRKIDNKDALILSIQGALNETEEAKFYHRLDLVLLAISGMPVKEISALYNESPTTISYWTKKVAEQGVDSLKSDAHTGRTPRLTAEQLKQLDTDLQKPPSAFGYDRNLWDGLVLSRHLEDHYSVCLKVRQCQRILRKLGYTLQRPQTKPYGSDPEAQETLKKLDDYAGYEIWYQDEVYFYRNSTICRMWTKCGSQPQMKSAPTQEKVAFSGFVNPATGQLVINECRKFNYETIMESVQLSKASDLTLMKRKALIQGRL